MSTSTLPWRKRSIDGDSPIDNKRPKNDYYYIRLASESPSDSDDDTESIYSIQDKETDFVKDTSDTNSNSEYEVEIEYDLASLSDSDREGMFFNSSSDSEDFMLAAAAVCDSSLEAFITDAEDSDNSLQEDSSSTLRDFWTCVQCKSQNNNPQFRFCDKCFQDRKTFFPPRPRRHKKAKRSKEKSKSHSPVKLDALQSCLSGLSQDSGIGSSQEFPSLCLEKIVVPKHLSPEVSNEPSTSLQHDPKSRKRQISESSLSDEYEIQRPPKHSKAKAEKNEEKSAEATPVEESADVKERTKVEADEVKGPLPECKEICIICNVNPKNSVFLHGRIAHMCCCYKCAMRTWKSLKRCPICKRKVSNVVRVFTT